MEKGQVLLALLVGPSKHSSREMKKGRTVPAMASSKMPAPSSTITLHLDIFTVGVEGRPGHEPWAHPCPGVALPGSALLGAGPAASPPV